MKKIIVATVFATVALIQMAFGQGQINKDSSSNAPIKAYIVLKDALVSSDVEAAKKAAEKLKSTLSSCGGSHVKLVRSAQQNTEDIATADDIEDQRASFATLSKDIIALAKAGDIKANGYYIHHCGMALNGKGADWISAEMQIRNPYFGNKMLHCGQMKGQL